MSPLFRPEARRHRGDRLHGEVIIAPSLPASLLTSLLLILFLGLITWLSSGSYARTETARGLLVSGTRAVKIQAPRAGTVSSLLVSEGDIVTQGQRLAVIQLEQSGATGGRLSVDALASLDEQERLGRERLTLAAQRGAQEARRLTVTVDSLLQQRLGLVRQIALQAEFVSSTRTSFESISDLVRRGVISQAESERRRQAFIMAQQEQGRFVQQLAGTDAELERAQGDRARIAVDMQRDIGEISAAIESILQQKARLLNEVSYSLDAPVSGRVASLQTQPGRATSGTVPLMSIMPVDAVLEAEIFVPTRAIGFVTVGQDVRLLYDAFPYQRFGSFPARVTSISHVVLGAGEVDAPLKFDEPVYRISASLTEQGIRAFGETLALRPGLLLTANMILDRRSFLDWLLAPVLAVGRRSG